MAMPARLKSELDQSHIAYSAVSHVPTQLAQFTASMIHVPGKKVAKTVVLRSGWRMFLAVLPASYRINFSRLAAIIGAPVQLVEEQEYKRLFPDCERGAIPPFGELYGLPVFLDETLAEDPQIIFNAGTCSDSVRISNADFIRLVKPKIWKFAEKP